MTPTTRTSHLDQDTGSATILGVLLISALASVVMIFSAAGSWVLTRAHASMVADLAALRAATDGSCAAAQSVAHLHHALVSECQWQGTDVIVTVVVESPSGLVRPLAGTIQARARAGF